MGTELAGRTAVVTGASRGLGREIAAGLAGAGARVVAVARDAEALGAAVEAMPGEVTALPVDLADVEGIPAAVAGVGDVDVLVNAAAVMSARRSKTLEVSLADWRAVRDVDLDAPFALVAAFVPAMVERRWGRVVNVTACLGRMSGPGTAGGLAPYRVAKAGLNALTRNLAHELGAGRRGVLVDATCPGHCRTDMGGPDAPRSVEEGADTAVWLACRPGSPSDPPPTGRLWEDRVEVPW
ncbi:SDR family NAD(P)-dependent oxidoreductase [Actinomycetospora sp. TBRC 11914]|uniref:SDR family NAD(P)-dependent oxidoreductase n=1 Tax=Actinomycetospora sp. TBRC 11914 TaxID=2729387 RepID=UPI00145EAFFA|nr:SDR family NAD(P)-dependent oxidoreductase [Actinomycetospora sp. TBRC 11914]NMO88983.1 SDR family NAD(P)-dependent oxidoreductase [Actinomycetospora sp. TBRC 11914]